MEVDGNIYLLPGDYPIDKGNYVLSDHALRLNDVCEKLRVKRTNVMFYAGCQIIRLLSDIWQRNNRRRLGGN